MSETNGNLRKKGGFAEGGRAQQRPELVVVESAVVIAVSTVAVCEKQIRAGVGEQRLESESAFDSEVEELAEAVVWIGGVMLERLYPKHADLLEVDHLMPIVVFHIWSE